MQWCGRPFFSNPGYPFGLPGRVASVPASSAGVQGSNRGAKQLRLIVPFPEILDRN